MSAPAGRDAFEQERELAPRRCVAQIHARAIIAPAPVHTPSIAATIPAAGTASLSPVIRAKRHGSWRIPPIATSGPMISCTSPRGKEKCRLRRWGDALDHLPLACATQPALQRLVVRI